MDIAIMIEAQNGLTWPRWKNLAAAVEDLGFAGLYRSDHFTNAQPPDMESLELWVSLTWLASHTKRIEFGPLVSPVSVRNPVLTARMASAVDDLSGGRLTLGLGAGWQEREHEMFGFDLLDMKSRFDRFEEGLEVVTRLLKSDSPVNYAGKYYQLRGATLLPHPARSGGPRLPPQSSPPPAHTAELHQAEIFTNILGSHETLELNISNLPDGLKLTDCTQRYDSRIIPVPNTIRTCSITGIPRTAGTFQLAVTARIVNERVDSVTTIPLIVKGQ
jgi:alkanesulfonate monooxygenase SsuD/methylene tetrahydromethanopterin reductase-like flavin-dependent oxidoreductase (luciferase family)